MINIWGHFRKYVMLILLSHKSTVHIILLMHFILYIANIFPPPYMALSFHSS